MNMTNSYNRPSLLAAVIVSCSAYTQARFAKSLYYALVGVRHGIILFSPIFFFAKLQNAYNVYNSPIRDQIVALDKLYILI